MDSAASSSDGEEGQSLSITIEPPLAPDNNSSSRSSDSKLNTSGSMNPDDVSAARHRVLGVNSNVVSVRETKASAILTAKRRKQTQQGSMAISTSTSSGAGTNGSTSNSSSSSSSSFPTPFKCCGDFCGVVLHEQPQGHEKTGFGLKETTNTGGGYANKYRFGSTVAVSKALPASTAVQMLFSQDELATLGNENLSHLLSSSHIGSRDSSEVSNASAKISAAGNTTAASADEELHVITYKSIALAKANREHLTASLQVQRRLFDKGDLSSGGGTTKKKSGQGARRAARRSSLFDSTASQEFREGSRLRVFGEMGEGVANYYRQVRVCSDCYAVYTLLDMTRKFTSFSLAKNSEGALEKHKRKQQRLVEKTQQKIRGEWEKHVASELEDKEKLYLRKITQKKETSSSSSNKSPGLRKTNRFAEEQEEAPLDDLDLAKLEREPGFPAVTASSSGRRLNGCGGVVGDTLPVLLSPKGLPFGRKELLGDSEAKQTSLLSASGLGFGSGQSTSMPVLLSASSLSSSGTIDKATKPSLFRSTLPGASPSSDLTKQMLRGSDTFKGLDKYLRGESKQIEEPTLVEGQLFKSTDGADTSLGASTTSSSSTSRKARPKTPTTVSTVLLVDSDPRSLELLHRALSSVAVLSLDIESIVDAHEALQAAKTFPYDLILCERDLTASTTTSSKNEVLSGLEFTKLLRQFELQKSITSSQKAKGPSLASKRTTVICVTSKTTREDLQLYRDVGMDGCVGKPIHQDSLQHTVQAALAKVASSSSSSGAAGNLSTTSDPNGNAAVTSATEALAQAKLEQQERKRRRRRRIEASSALPFPGIADMDAQDDYVAGTFQMDAETAIPYCVLGNPVLQPQHVPNTFFNLVVIHDIFDTWERLQILLNPIIARYHGAIQVLVWNYPGQAYTIWRPGTLLNNVYHVQCFHALLQHVGPRGLGLWRDAPYYLMGIGNGGNIATAFCSHSPPLNPNTRALLLVNSFAYIDAQLAQFFHDCLKVFSCTPESRPDLPVYFHTRFLFSSAYLARVSTPLALNLYTAVMNPITLDGRKALCQGALAHADLKTTGELATRLRVPFLNVCSSQNALVDAGTQTQKILDVCGLEAVDSIGKVLRQRVNGGGRKNKSSCIIWLPSGHEIFQECKQDMLLLVEQLVTGYHEVNDVLPGKTSNVSGPGPNVNGLIPNKRAPDTQINSREKLSAPPHHHREKDEARAQRTKASANSISNSNNSSSFEDSFINNVLSTVKQVVVVAPQASLRPSSRGAADTNISNNNNNNNQLQSPEKAKWTQFQHEKAQKILSKGSVEVASRSLKTTSASKKETSPPKLIAMTSWDPTTPVFERLSSNIIYKIGESSKIYPDNSSSSSSSSAKAVASKAPMPELKEYMEWRVKRNLKRLQRMEKQARVIQRAFRAFYAHTLIIRIKRERCAVALQRLWRAKLAQKKYKGMKKEDWAVRLLQRNWRGKMGRDSYRDRVCKYLAAIDIQRVVRGYLAVMFVTRIRHKMHTSAVEIQRVVRQYLAKKRMFLQRLRRNSAVCIQRVFRGHLGRKRFAHEKDKFLYSKTQSQGIAFGKQMLLEYKLYGTKLQSEVALLTKAKEDVERQAEVLVNEICEFDEGIRLLEMEMHTLSQVETESMAKNMDEQGKWQLREQKMRLDREFTQMLAQTALRKENLSVLEEQLHQLDKERLSKEEEVKSLERKLVIMLEEQQQELAKIKSKQQTRNQLMLDLIPPNSSSSGAGAGTPGFHMGSSLVSGSPWSGQSPSGGGPRSTMNGSAYTPSAVVNAASAFTQQQREEANLLMESTETMMKFGFMSMSMTYFSSMNMVRAMRKIGAHHMTLDSATVVSNKKWPEYATSGGNPGSPTVPGSAASPFGFSDGSGGGFQPAIPPGSFPGQQPLQVAGWSVADVGRWLDTLALGQYKRAFSDAAVDGALLLHLNDDDLKNTLGMEHRLHRKKILTSVEQLRETERVKMKKLYGASGSPDNLPVGGGSSSNGNLPASPQRMQPSPMTQTQTQVPPSSPTRGSPPIPDTSSSSAEGDTTPSVSSVAGANLKVVVGFSEFCTLVRHGKLKQLKEALANVSDRRFDPLTVMQPFNPGVGTIYDDLLENSIFHINKSDENGNSPLLLAAQNNNLKVAQLLLAKGANPNHQNKNGNTAGHYAMAYSFFDLGAWLLDPEKGGGRDDLLNDNGLTAYDGLQ